MDFDADSLHDQLSVVNIKQLEESVNEELVEGIINDLKCDEILLDHIKKNTCVPTPCMVIYFLKTQLKKCY